MVVNGRGPSPPFTGFVANPALAPVPQWSGLSHYNPPLMDWTALAACKKADPDPVKRTNIFFPRQNQSDLRAKQICRECPVRAQCLDTAIRGGPDYRGVWGGTSERERRRIRRDYIRGERERLGLVQDLRPVRHSLYANSLAALDQGHR